MASSITKHRLLLLAAAVALTLAAVPAPMADDDKQVHLHMYMHDIVGPPGQKSVLVVKGSGPMNPSMPPGHYFGETYAFDDLLTEGRSASSRPVGRAQGTYMLASMRRPVYVVDMVMLLTEGEYNGSTLVVEGRHDASQEVRELAVTGGTGMLRRASGYVRCRTVREETKYTVYELDANVTLPGNDSSSDPSPGPGPGMTQYPLF